MTACKKIVIKMFKSLLYITTLMWCSLQVLATAWDNPGSFNEDFFSDYASATAGMELSTVLPKLGLIMFPAVLAGYVLYLARHGSNERGRGKIIAIIGSLVLAGALCALEVKYPGLMRMTIGRLIDGNFPGN